MASRLGIISLPCRSALRLAWLMDVSWQEAVARTQTKTPLGERRFFTTGAGDRNRTDDLRITNALLYQLSYAGEKQGAL